MSAIFCSLCDKRGVRSRMVHFFQVIDGFLCAVFACPTCGEWSSKVVVRELGEGEL